MARGYNKVILVGNLGQDPELRSTQSGNQVANLNLATDESYKDRNTSQMVPKTEWHRVVLFGKIAEIAGKYLKKGSKALIEGKLQTRKWKNKEGFDVYTTEVVVDIEGHMQMLDTLQKDTNNQQSSEGYQSQKTAQQGSSYQGQGYQPQYSQEDAPDNGYGGYDQSTEDDINPDDDVPF